MIFNKNYLIACISQDDYDVKWLDLRNKTFTYMNVIISSISVEQLLAFPQLFQLLCKVLTSWYLLSHNEMIFGFDDEFYFEQSMDPSSKSVSTKKYCLSFIENDIYL